VDLGVATDGLGMGQALPLTQIHVQQTRVWDYRPAESFGRGLGGLDRPLERAGIDAGDGFASQPDGLS
jgi:hypothetical protein